MMLQREQPSLKHLSQENIARAWAISQNVGDREHIAISTRHMPRELHKIIIDHYGEKFRDKGYFEANQELLDCSKIFACGLDLSSDDDEIIEQSKNAAQEARNYMADAVTKDCQYSPLIRTRLAKYCSVRGVKPPDCKTLKGMVLRLGDDKWWRRALRRGIVRGVERQFINFGMVKKGVSVYASRSAIKRREIQQRRNAKAMAAMMAVNSLGQEIPLSEIIEKSIANPKLRRVELMTRSRGFEDFAIKRGDVGMFYTITCPSRMHARYEASGQVNPKYDGTSPKQAQQYLSYLWQLIRAKFSRKDVYVYGIRVAEPHHDGTPHWHIALFMRPEYERFVTATMRAYATRSDADELNNDAAKKARFDVIEIDWERGGFTAYLAKYLAKNIDGHQVGVDIEAGENSLDTVRNVDAWASTWGIRQFQQVGGPGVTIWRELRRLVGDQQMPLFEVQRKAADEGDWGAFVQSMGGIEIRKRDRSLGLWRVITDKENAYGETCQPIIEGVKHVMLEFCRTRFLDWRIERKRDNRRTNKQSGVVPGASGAVAVDFDLPWTRVNNCTESLESIAWRMDYENFENETETDRKIVKSGRKNHDLRAEI